MGDALPNHNATLPTRNTPEPCLPGTTTAPTTRTTWPTTPNTAKHQAAKNRKQLLPRPRHRLIRIKPKD